MTRKNPKQNSLSLRLEKLRRLTNDSLGQVGGGGTDDVIVDIKCPQATWHTSKSAGRTHTQ